MTISRQEMRGIGDAAKQAIIEAAPAIAARLDVVIWADLQARLERAEHATLRQSIAAANHLAAWVDTEPHCQRLVALSRDGGIWHGDPEANIVAQAAGTIALLRDALALAKGPMPAPAPAPIPAPEPEPAVIPLMRMPLGEGDAVAAEPVPAPMAAEDQKALAKQRYENGESPVAIERSMGLEKNRVSQWQYRYGWRNPRRGNTMVPDFGEAFEAAAHVEPAPIDTPALPAAPVVEPIAVAPAPIPQAPEPPRIVAPPAPAAIVEPHRVEPRRLAPQAAPPSAAAVKREARELFALGHKARFVADDLGEGLNVISAWKAEWDAERAAALRKAVAA